MDNRAITAPGELIIASGTNYHVRRFGQRGPVILLECGLTMMSSCWGWIAPELANFARVITYDRAGLGWSENREGLRDPRTLAAELAELLKVFSLREPVVLLGHSMGAMVNRAFLKVSPLPVRAIVWLDPAHPDQINRRGIRRRMRNLVFYIEAAQLLAKRGVPAIEVPLVRHLDELPENEFRALRRFLRDPTHLRTCASEARAWGQSIESMTGLGDLPVLILSARKNALPGWKELQNDLALSSSNTVHKELGEISHISMLARREHALQVVGEIRGFLENLSL